MLETAPASLNHGAFLYKLYVSTRIDEVTAWGWDDTTREHFLKMQWNAQSRYYADQYPNAEHSVVCFNGELVGRIMIDCTERDISLVDISILPEYRNQGIGTSLIAALQAEAERTGKSLRLTVLKGSPAVRLYERLGFETSQLNDLHYSMKWSIGQSF
jgi:ribosomal protein S18 acetylase RimI-like enzyme